MKSIKLILAVLACALFFVGCGSANGAGEPDAEKQELSENLQAYREVILELQREIEALRAEQVAQAAEYEAEIDALERLLASVSASQTPATPDNSVSDYTYSVRDGCAVITSYLGTGTRVQVPDSIGGYPVVAIGENAFRNSKVEQVILPTGVKTIDWFAFYGSYRLQSVTLPSSVTTIEYGAFELCSSALKFTCSADSYAAQYAASYGIPVIEG